MIEQMLENNEIITKSRRGLIKNRTNPFLEDAWDNTKRGIKKISNKDGSRMLVINEKTGEIVAPAGFWHTQEVDKTQFVKLYIGGVKALKELTGSGTKVFEILYLKIQETIGTDIIWLSFTEINQDAIILSKATFNRGMKELLEKGFIAETITQNKYFINPDYLFNGNRLAFVKEYKMRK